MTYSITCIAPLAKRDALNAAMDEAGLPSGLTVAVRKNPNAQQSHCLQHCSGDAAMLAAYQAIGNGLLVKAVDGRDHARGWETANEHMAENGMKYMPVEAL